MKKVTVSPVRPEYHVGDVVPIDEAFLGTLKNSPFETGQSGTITTVASATLWISYRPSRGGMASLAGNVSLTIGTPAPTVITGRYQNPITGLFAPITATAPNGNPYSLTFKPNRPGLYTVHFLSTLSTNNVQVRRQIHWRGETILVRP